MIFFSFTQLFIVFFHFIKRENIKHSLSAYIEMAAAWCVPHRWVSNLLLVDAHSICEFGSSLSYIVVTTSRARHAVNQVLGFAIHCWINVEMHTVLEHYGWAGLKKRTWLILYYLLVCSVMLLWAAAIRFWSWTIV